MKVLNRDGDLTNISFDAVKERIESLCSAEELDAVDIDVVVTQTVNGFKDGISTFELDELSARVCANMQSVHYCYDSIAAKIIISNMAKTIRRVVLPSSIDYRHPTFSEKVEYIHRSMPKILDPTFVGFVDEHADVLDNYVDYERDSKYHSYFSIRTLQRSYLIKDANDVYVESPQDLWMRVAIVINMSDMSVDIVDRLASIRKCYDSMSTGEYTHATPTLFNAGMSNQQMCSCFLVGMNDSLSGIYSTLGDCALISKWAGGIGLHVSNIRAEGTRITSTGGTSDGIVPMLKVFNETARYCNQSGRRKGSFAIYLEPWHADIWKFTELRLNTGAETERARDLFLALWVPDEFMRRLETDEDWFLMSPDTCPGLVDAYGDDFSELYCRYVSERRYIKKIRARELWQQVLKSQIETGTPYIMYKDHVNRKCNQKNVGTIRSSNLCVAPETQILTTSGFQQISCLEDTTVRVWNGKTFSETVVRKTGTDQPLIRVSFSNGEHIYCTPYHKFYIRGSEECAVEAYQLREGDALAEYELPVVPDDDLLLPSEEQYQGGEGGVPTNHVLSEKLRYLERILNTSGWIMDDNEYKLKSMYILSKDRHLLVDIKRMLNTMGVDPFIGSNYRRECGVVETPFGDMMAQCHLRISPPDLVKLCDMGFAYGDFAKMKGIDSVEYRDAVARHSPYRSIVTVTDVNLASGRRDDTYCFNELLEHKGVFNGILTGQCAEITQYSDADEYAVCNLASIAIPKFVDKISKTINHEALHEAARQVTYNLNRIIDINAYPVQQADRSNRKMRPIGIGIQGLGDVYCMLKLPYSSTESIELDVQIMETIYHGALTASVELAEKHGPYERFNGSPASRGQLQMDMWNEAYVPQRYDWDALRTRIVRSGLRNSMLTALMPTASTSQILGNCESFEPFQSNVFKRTTLAGQFMVVNRHLMCDLIELGLWDDDMRIRIIENDGSVQGIEEIPDNLKQVYMTVWEIPQKSIIEHAAARGPFVDQSQSMNLYMMTPDIRLLRSILNLAWRRGLKTGMYYLRSLAASEASKFGVKSSNVSKLVDPPPQDAYSSCPLRKRGNNGKDDDDTECIACSG